MSLSEWKSSMPKRSLVQVDGKGDALEMPHSAVNPKQNDAPKNKAPLCAGLFYLRGGWVGDQSPSVSRDAFPPAAVVLMVIVFSVAKRGR